MILLWRLKTPENACRSMYRQTGLQGPTSARTPVRSDSHADERAHLGWKNVRMPWVRKAVVRRTVTLMVTGNSDDPYTLMIEPYGMTLRTGGETRCAYQGRATR